MQCLRFASLAALLTLTPWMLAAAEAPQIHDIPTDLTVPAVEESPPAAGKRVRQTTPGWEQTQVHHALYLPRDWKPGAKFPVLVEYAGNGGYRNARGDVCGGTVEGCNLGYGLSAGEGYIWVAMPFVEIVGGVKQNAPKWWGDVEESKRYCMATVEDVCARFGGDASRVVLGGFSRGAIACNCIGLHDDRIARLWCGFFCHSHYDGVREKQWYAEGDRPSALQRLARLDGRPVWISQEGSVAATQEYLQSQNARGRFTFEPLPFANHTDTWVLRDLPLRAKARQWLRAVTRPKIRVDRARHGFVDTAGSPFVPMGVNYYRPGTGWAPQLWKQFDVEATRRDFALLKNHGANVVRVFLSFGSFYTEPGKLNPEGLARFDQLLDLADASGLYVHPTGPDAWEGMPDWTKSLNVFSNDGNEPCLKALDDYWRMFAARYRHRNTIWAYDLRNEPHLAWDTPALRSQWDAWRKSHNEAPAAVPDPKATHPSPELADYQRFRESIAEKWVVRQSQAIHAADPEALVTVGLLQWSVPAQRIKLDQYAAFRPATIAKHLDFMELHFYPLAQGAYQYEGPAAESANLAVLEAMARECAKPGLPLVIAEFGWFGGGPLNPHGKPASEEQQAQWCRRLIEVTSPMACGWLNWGMYDHPQAKDVSRLTGLFTVDGQEKAWGRTFRELANQLQANPPRYALPERPDLPWDSCITSGDAMEQFRKAYLAAFEAAGKK